MSETDKKNDEQQPAAKKAALKLASARKNEPVQDVDSEPASEPVDGKVLADSLASHIGQYVRLNRDQLMACVLWVLHTHAFDAVEATPYLIATSAQKQSGKTRLQEVLEMIVRDPMRTSGTSEAALFRSIEAKRPSLLLDEIDAIFSGRSSSTEPLRGLLDSGNRRGGSITRAVPKGAGEWEAAQFATFCPKCLAGIDTGRFPDTLLDRSIVLRLARKKIEDEVAPFRQREAEEQATPLREDAEAWAEQNLDALTAARPAPVAGLSDRANDHWEPLLAIAKQVGADWSDEARAVAVQLHRAEQAQEDTPQILLLRAIRSVTHDAGDRWFTKDLIAKLNHEVEGEDAPWREQKDGLTAHQLARLLRPFGIEPGTIRDGKRTGKGYRRESFLDAWERYLPGEDEEVSV
jgi:hypothetical protein